MQGKGGLTEGGEGLENSQMFRIKESTFKYFFSQWKLQKTLQNILNLQKTETQHFKICEALKQFLYACGHLQHYMVILEKKENLQRCELPIKKTRKRRQIKFSTFSYVDWVFGCALLWNICLSILLIFLLSWISFSYLCIGTLHIFWMLVLCCTYILQIYFFHWESCLLIHLIVSFNEQKFLILK